MLLPLVWPIGPALLIQWIEQPPARDPSGAPRFSSPGDGTVVDHQTRLVWTQQHSGNLGGPEDAVRYCVGLDTAGGGWRLPSPEQLLTLYDTSLRTSCGGPQCRASSYFKLSTPRFWTSHFGPGKASLEVYLSTGEVSGWPVRRYQTRALCVRDLQR